MFSCTGRSLAFTQKKLKQDYPSVLLNGFRVSLSSFAPILELVNQEICTN